MLYPAEKKVVVYEKYKGGSRRSWYRSELEVITGRELALIQDGGRRDGASDQEG